MLPMPSLEKAGGAYLADTHHARKAISLMSVIKLNLYWYRCYDLKEYYFVERKAI